MNLSATIGPGKITDCFFINNNTETVELVGIQTKNPYTKSNCFSQFFGDTSWEINRTKVKLLKTGAINGPSLNENLYKSFKNLRIFDISNFGVKQLTSSALNLPCLEKLVASHNNLTSISEWIFLNLPNITEIDFSFNQITALNSENFRRALKLTVINVSNNKIVSLGPATFRSLSQLRTLHLNENFITAIYKTQFSEHKLDVLQLKNNPFAYVDCEFLPFLNGSLNDIRRIDTSCLSDSVEIDVNSPNDVVFRMANSSSELRCTKERFKNFTLLNISGNRMRNTSEILELLGPSIENVDLASNFIGKLDSQTFKKFNNLQYLNLSHTNLSNFGFKTFYHQSKLKTLDLGYNHLRTVNFTLLLRNFKNLTTLNLEGNDLIEINSVTRSNFPSLSFLGLSKNRFSCDYLATFLRQWEGLQLFHNPSDETHIDGVDCNHDDGNIDGAENEEMNEFSDATEATDLIEVTENVEDVSNINVERKTNTKLSNPPNTDHKKNKIELTNKSAHTSLEQTEKRSTDFRVIERVLLVLCIVCCGYLVLRKSKSIQEIKQKLARAYMERNVAYVNENHGSQNDIALIDS